MLKTRKLLSILTVLSILSVSITACSKAENAEEPVTIEVKESFQRDDNGNSINETQQQNASTKAETTAENTEDSQPASEEITLEQTEGPSTSEETTPETSTTVQQQTTAATNATAATRAEQPSSTQAVTAVQSSEAATPVATQPVTQQATQPVTQQAVTQPQTEAATEEQTTTQVSGPQAGVALTIDQAAGISATNYNTYSAYIEEVAALINQFRAENGLGAIPLNYTASLAAGVRSAEGAHLDYFSHERPDGTKMSTVINYYGIQWARCGENLGRYQSTPSEIVEGWKNSTAGHREIMLKTGWTSMGIGVAADSEGYLYWTAVFIE